LSTFCPNELKREGILLQHDFKVSVFATLFAGVTFLLTGAATIFFVLIVFGPTVFEIAFYLGYPFFAGPLY